MSSMIADLVGALNNLEQTHKDITYRSVLFPAPAMTQQVIDAMRSSGIVKHTFTMDPQERPPRIPFFQLFALEEPSCRSTMSCNRSKDVVRRWVRRRQPIFDVSL